MDKYDVVNRAIEIIEERGAANSNCDAGRFCPFCAISHAKDELDEEKGGGVPFNEVVSQIFLTGIRACDEDIPLIEARKALGDICPPFTKKTAKSALMAVLP